MQIAFRLFFLRRDPLGIIYQPTLPNHLEDEWWMVGGSIVTFWGNLQKSGCY